LEVVRFLVISPLKVVAVVALVLLVIMLLAVLAVAETITTLLVDLAFLEKALMVGLVQEPITSGVLLAVGVLAH
jgi:hypothetical protein